MRQAVFAKKLTGQPFVVGNLNGCLGRHNDAGLGFLFDGIAVGGEERQVELGTDQHDIDI